jgi:hypothetical protein
MKPIRGLLFPVNGRVRGVELSGGNDNLKDMYDAIGCQTVEHFQLLGGPDGEDIIGLWFDEEFRLVDMPVMNRVFTVPRRPGQVLSLGGNILAFASFEGETISLPLDGAQQVIELVRGYVPNPQLDEKRSLRDICADLEWRPTDDQLRRWLNDGERWWSP